MRMAGLCVMMPLPKGEGRKCDPSLVKAEAPVQAAEEEKAPVVVAAAGELAMILR